MPERGRIGTAKGFVERTGSGARILCPKCGGSDPHRRERKGFWQMKVYPLFGYYPWTCPDCRSHFMIQKRYRRKSVQSEEPVSRQLVKKG